MNYISQIKGFWLLQEKHALGTTDIALYFYLLEVCNSTNWVNPFRRNTAKLLADLHITRATFYRARNRLNKAGIVNAKSMNGSPNVTYVLTDLELGYQKSKGRQTGNDTGDSTGSDTGTVTGSATLNKNSKPKHKLKPKQVAVVSYANATEFFVGTSNCRLLKEKFGLPVDTIADYYKTFYDSKIDLGGLDNKTLAEIAKNFYYWLPKHLAAGQKDKEKSYAKKESNLQSATAQPLRGVAAALKFAGVKMREEI